MLINQLEGMGGTWQKDLKVKFHNYIPYSLMEAPINWVRTWVRNLGLQKTMAAAGARRPTMAGAQHYDHETHVTLNKVRDEQLNQDMLLIQTGGLWTANALHKAGYLAQPTCTWCGAAKEDLTHLWWECPTHVEHRKETMEMLQKEMSRCRRA